VETCRHGVYLTLAIEREPGRELLVVDDQRGLGLSGGGRLRTRSGLCGKLLQEVVVVAVVEVDLAQHRTCAQQRLDLPKSLDFI